MKQRILIIMIMIMVLAAVPARAQEKDALTVAGEYLGFHYALEEFNETFCGPIGGGPYGSDPAVEFLQKYLTPEEMTELHKYIDQNYDKDHAYFRGILNDNFRKRRDTSATLDDVCAEFEPIYRKLFDEAEEQVRTLR